MHLLIITLFMIFFLHFQAMTDDEKARYKDKAKGGNIRITRRPANDGDGDENGNTRSGLFTSQGIPVATYDREKREMEQETKRMHRRIDNMLHRDVPLMTGTLFMQK